MRQVKAALLLIEAIICFGPFILFLLFAVLSMPQVVLSASQNPYAFFSILVVLGGCAGTYGLFRLLKSILLPDAPVPPPLLLWISLGAGIGSLVLVSKSILAILPDIAIWPPVLATAHFVYIGRRFFFPGAANKTMEPTR